MYCPKCGVALVNGKCPVCGRTENSDNSRNNQTIYIQNGQDGKNVGYNVLSFFFPLVGLIFFCIWKDQFPIRAKECGKWALISVIASTVLTIIAYALLAGSIAVMGRNFGTADNFGTLAAYIPYIF